MSRWCDVVLLLGTRSLYLGVWLGGGGRVVHLTRHQSNPQPDDMSCWPAVVPPLTTRCLYLGWGGVSGASRGVGVAGGIRGYIWKMKTVSCKVLLKTQDGLLQTIEHELRSTRPKIVPLLATRCLSLGALRGGVHLTKQQPDPQADDMSFWLAVVPLLTTRCLYWWLGHWGQAWGIREPAGGIGVVGIGGYIWKMKTVCCKVLLKTEIWAQVNLTYVSPIPHHQVPLSCGTSESRLTGPMLVPSLAPRCLYQGVHLTSGSGWHFVQ